MGKLGRVIAVTLAVATSGCAVTTSRVAIVPHVSDLEGVYDVRGLNPDGSQYEGVVALTTHDPGIVHATWTIADGTQHGVGVLQRDVLALFWYASEGGVGVTSCAIDRAPGSGTGMAFQFTCRWLLVAQGDEAEGRETWVQAAAGPPARPAAVQVAARAGRLTRVAVHNQSRSYTLAVGRVMATEEEQLHCRFSVGGVPHAFMITTLLEHVGCLRLREFVEATGTIQFVMD